MGDDAGITDMLRAWGAGDQPPLAPLVQDELQRAATAT